MRKFTDYLASQFGDPTGWFGRLCCKLMNLSNQALYRKAAALVAQTAGSKLLDVGYGNGYLLQLIDHSSRQWDLYGIDISADMKDAAQQRNQKALTQGRLHLKVGDCCALPFPDGIFDATTSVNTIYFWGDTAQGLREICRCLTVGGVFYNVCYTKRFLDKLPYTRTFQKFTPEELVRLGHEAGFQTVEVQVVTKGVSFVVRYQK
jgi:ubiquinone/menaquinone biosynthesis C-methylase UbiE